MSDLRRETHADLPRPCPDCKAIALTLRYWMEPVTSFSLAGNQMKLAAAWLAVVECKECGARHNGRLINPTINNGVFTGGHFQEDPQ